MENIDNINVDAEKAAEAKAAEAKAIEEKIESDKLEAEKAAIKAEKAAIKADSKKAKEQKEETVLVKFLLSPCGVFHLPWNVGDEVEIEVNQANEIVEAKYGEFVK